MLYLIHTILIEINRLFVCSVAQVVTESEIKKLEEEYTSYLEASSKSSDKLCTQWSERLRWNENILPDRIGRNDKDVNFLFFN